jgi:hypothetical protein
MGENEYSADMDRSTRAYHDARKHETWYGLILQVANPSGIGIVKNDLDAILTASGHQPSAAGGCSEIYCKGAYSKKILEKIEAYAVQNKGIVDLFVGEGKYFDFIGWRDWTQKLKESLSKK